MPPVPEDKEGQPVDVHKNVIVSVINRYNWPPQIIGGLFYDDLDHEGILLWYEEVRKESEKSDSLLPKK